MLDVTQISEYFNITKQQTYNHIKNKNLIAKKIDGKYYVELNNFNSFKEFFYEKKHKKKGVKTPTPNNFEALENFVLDIKDTDISSKIFEHKYKEIALLVPKLDSFLKLKRNVMIIHEFESENTSQKKLSEKYKLSIASIKEITRNKDRYNLNKKSNTKVL